MFVGTVVLFVHNDESQVLDGGKNGGTCPDHDGFFAFPDGPPGVVSFACRQGAVEYGDLVAEMGAESADGLGCEGDFGHQDNGTFARFLGPCDGLNINQGFAGSGNTVQEVYPEGVVVLAL